jgi:hypothetical protein
MSTIPKAARLRTARRNGWVAYTTWRLHQLAISQLRGMSDREIKNANDAHQWPDQLKPAGKSPKKLEETGMDTLRMIFAALTSLAITLTPAVAGESAGPSVTAKRAALAEVLGEAREAKMLRPVTWGIEQPSSPTTLEQKSALAPSNAASAAKPVFHPEVSRAAEIVIDVLVAYTRKAAQHYYEIEREVVALAIEEANHSFRLSGIGHIRLRLAQTFQTGYLERGNHFDHVWSMADKDDEHMERIHVLREAYRADVAILIVDDPKGCGLATRIGADADEAFAVVHHACAVANYKVAHEIGHLIGARHELSASGISWRDIMSYKETCSGCPRLPVWSDPFILMAGEAVGAAGLNNTRIIAENAWRVASFR